MYLSHRSRGSITWISLSVNYRQLKQAACNSLHEGQLELTSGYHRLIDESPDLNITGRVGVSMGRETTLNTPECILREPVLTGNVEASAAFLRRISGINANHRDTGKFGFVFDIRSQLIEAPIGKPVSLPASGLDSLADTDQIFETDSTSGALRRLNNGFRDAVINVFLISGLLTRYLFELAFSRSGTVTLKVATSVGENTPLAFDLCPAIDRAFTIGGNIHNAEIDAQDIHSRITARIGNVAGAGQIPFTSDKHQIRLALAKRQKFALVFTGTPLDFDSPINSPDTDRIVRSKAENAIIIGLRRMFAEVSASLFIKLVGIGDFGNATYDYLCRQSETLFTLVINKFVQGVLSERLSIPCTTANPVASRIRRFQRLLECYSVFRSRFQFNGGSKFHIVKYREI